MDKIVHYYVYYYALGDPIPIYERTCGTEQDAKKRVAHIQAKWGKDAFFSSCRPGEKGFPPRFYY